MGASKSEPGSSRVDKESITDFERDLKGNLYKIWNRMSSGSYIPPPVRTVEIPKKTGGERMLGFLPWPIEWLRWLCSCIWTDGRATLS